MTKLINDVTAEPKRTFVMNKQQAWHRNLLMVIARHYRCLVSERDGAYWLVGVNPENVQEARSEFYSVLATFRATARDLGAVNRPAKRAVYASLLAQLTEQLKSRHLPERLVQYAERHELQLAA